MHDAQSTFKSRSSNKHNPLLTVKMPRKGLLERLADGVVIGDGGFVTIMEKRGYSRIGAWTPEATVEHPEAGESVYSTSVIRI